MDSTGKSVKIVALYVFPAIILILMTVIFIVPVPKRTGTLEGRLVLSSGETPITRTIVVYEKGSSVIIANIHPDATGSYSVTLPVNTYVVDLAKNKTDRSTDVPKVIHIDHDVVTRVDIAVTP